MQSLNTIPLKSRICECCHGTDFETLWGYKHTTTTRTTKWLFEVHNVICKNCGFVFTAPALDDQVLLEYYEDSFATFTGQALDYSVEKRMKVIKEFVPAGATFFEVGANLKSSFNEQLKQHVGKVLTLEPNQSAESDFRSVEELNEIKVDCVAHYFVLEHVPTVKSFLGYYANIIKDGGIMICEVPLLDLYETFITPLILFEHVNHFTGDTLVHIASKLGLELVHISTEDCSRPFGFVTVFRKTGAAATQVPAQYNRNLSLFNTGMSKVQAFLDMLTTGWEVIKKAEANNELVVVWAANESSNRLFDGKEIPGNVVIIDSDPRKANFFEGRKPVFQAADKAAEIKQAAYVIICTQHYSQVILDSVRQNFNKEFAPGNTFIIDAC